MCNTHILYMQYTKRHNTGITSVTQLAMYKKCQVTANIKHKQEHCDTLRFYNGKYVDLLIQFDSVQCYNMTLHYRMV